jgi:hypothetical protein
MWRSVVFGISTAAAFASNAQRLDIGPELWDRPRTGAAVLAHDSIKSAALAVLARPEARIVIHHAAGQEPAVQAEELRAWLGALAIDPQRIVLRGDLEPASAIKIEVLP